MENFSPLQVTLDSHGQIDLDVLERSASVPALRDWMSARLRGRDPYLPVDHANLEAPYDLLVSTYRRMANGQPLRAMMGRAAADLLAELWEQPPEQWHEQLLHFVSAVHPDPCKMLLLSVVRVDAFSQQHREFGLDIRWLDAAAQYPPNTTEIATAWMQLLDHQEYSGVAFQATLHDAHQAAAILPRYWRSLPSEHRSFLLEQAVRDLMFRWPGLWKAALLRQQAILAQDADFFDALKCVLEEIGPPLRFGQVNEPDDEDDDDGDLYTDIAALAPVEAAT